MENQPSRNLSSFFEKIEITNEKRDYEVGVNTPIELYDSYKISVLLSDGMAVVMKDQIYNTSCGDVVLFRPDELHFARILKGGEHRFMTFLIPTTLLFELGGEELAYIFEDSGENRVNHIITEPSEKLEIIRICEKITETHFHEKSSALCTFAYVIELLHYCRGLYEKAKTKPALSATPAVITGAMRYITKNYKTVKSLDEIARNVHCSVTYLTRIFKQHTGKTVWTYLTECRLAYAKNMLDSGMDVTDVCYEVGFSDCSGFIKIFKSYEGITPLKYKKRRLQPI